jgi:hypothetical protein
MLGWSRTNSVIAVTSVQTRVDPGGHGVRSCDFRAGFWALFIGAAQDPKHAERPRTAPSQCGRAEVPTAMVAAPPVKRNHPEASVPEVLTLRNTERV